MTTAQIAADKYIIVDDGQFKFPAPVENVQKSGKTLADLKRMDGEQYSAWCDDVGMDRSRGDVGSQGCIDFCNELAEGGADVWYIG